MRTLGMLATALVLGASSATAQAGPEITDSAGVRVVTNAAPRANGPSFRLSAAPRASIGQVQGAPEYELFRATQAFVLGDGTIVVANSGTQELRFFDRAGKYLRTAGRSGEGPGEFAFLTVIGPFAGDSLLVSDTRLKRYSVFDRAGKFVRSFPAPAELGPINYLTAGVVGDGRLVAFGNFIGPVPEESARQRRTVPIRFVTTDGRLAGTLGEFPGTEVMTGGATRAMTTGPVIFGRRLHVRARGDRIAVGNDDRYSVRIYDGSGKLLHVVRQTRAPVTVRPDDFERALPPTLRGGATPNGALGRNLRAMIDDVMYRYTTLPAYGGAGSETSSLRFDPAGGLWVQEYQIESEEPAAWQAFDRDGVFLGRLALRARATLLDVGADWVLLRTLDELDVEHIQLYGLERPARSR
jgi:hypothetical protein